MLGGLDYADVISSQHSLRQHGLAKRMLGIGEPKVEDEMIKEINIMYSSTFRLQNIITPGISFHP